MNTLLTGLVVRSVDMDTGSEYTVEATETSLRVLEALTDQEGVSGVTQLADRLDLSKSVVHNHLSTLRDRGYVVKRSSGYAASLRPLSLGARAREHLRTCRVAKPKVDNLAAASGETTMLFVLEESAGVPAYVVEPSDGWQSSFRVGERYPLPVTAPGKAILATLSTEQLDAVFEATAFEAYTDATVTDRAELETELRRIRDDGIAFCRGEHQSGVVGVAAPIEAGDSQTVAALGVCGPVERLNGRYLEEDIPGQVLSTVRSIQVELTSG
jgi:DNA-binding IclR family transcriptional regulator